MKFSEILLRGYLGSAAGMFTVLVLSMFLWDKKISGSIIQAIPACFTLQLTFVLPFMLGAFIAI